MHRLLRARRGAALAGVALIELEYPRFNPYVGNPQWGEYMRRLGTILMILGVNLAVGSFAAAFWLAAFECAMNPADDSCRRGVIERFVGLMGSGDGIVFWAVIVAGLLVFWQGKRMRARDSR